jgi:hypothetical protein
MADRADRFAPAETLLDALAPALARCLAVVPRRAIGGATAGAARVARNMRGKLLCSGTP